MARIMTCARGLASLMRGEAWSATGLPECFEPTAQRLLMTSKSVVQSWLDFYDRGEGMLH